MDKAIIMDHVSYDNYLSDVSLTIQKDEFVGIVGDSNKSSILKVISGLSKITSGFVSVLGYDPYLKSFEYLKKISLLMEQEEIYFNEILPIDLLKITKEIYSISTREFNKNISELIQYINDLNLLNSLIYKPEILLLDHPNFDLEPVYNYHKKYRSTILISTDKIDDLVNIVRRVILIDKAQIVFDGAIDDIFTKFATEKIIKAKLSSNIDTKSVETIGTVKKYIYPYIYISVPKSVVSFAAAELIQNLPVTSLDIEELPVEEIIKNIKDNA